MKSIIEIHSIAIKSETGESFRSLLEVRVRQLNVQLDVIIHALVQFNRINKFETFDSLETQDFIDRMEFIYYEINSITSSSLFAQTSPVLITNPAHNILPKIELPKFDRNITNCKPFQYTFNLLVNKNSTIDKIERFHYLLACLSGLAYDVIKSVPLSEENYDIAWTSLTGQYLNQRLLATAQLEKIFSFRTMNQETVSTLSTFINVFQENIAEIKALDVENLAGFFKFYIGSRVLDKNSKKLFKSSISLLTTPTFDDLLEFVQQRRRILENV